MGLFDFFFGTPSQDKFARLFMAEMRRAGDQRSLHYDPNGFRIIVGEATDHNQIFLHNFYKEHLSLRRRDRQRHLEHRARVLGPADGDLPSDFELARANLRPKVWSRAAVEKTRLQAELDGGDPSTLAMPDYELGSHLIASVAYDLPESVRSLSQSELEAWGISYYEALEIARQNLEQTQYVIAKVGEGFYAFTTGDSYDSCRILLDSVLEPLEVQGDPIALIPNRDSLFFTGSDDDQGLEVMLTLTEKAMETPRPLVPIALRRINEDWVDWMPPRGHRFFDRFKQLELSYLAPEYAEQKEMLDALHARKGIDRFVATYFVTQEPDSELCSRAVWTKNVETLLPRTDRVHFFREGEGTVADAPWERVQQVMGHLMKPDVSYPPRYLVAGFPTDEQLQKVRSKK